VLEILVARIRKTDVGSSRAHTEPAQIEITEVPFLINTVLALLHVNGQGKVSIQAFLYEYFVLQKGFDKCETRENVCICRFARGRNKRTDKLAG
jgi:hypothetical protein